MDDDSTSDRRLKFYGLTDLATTPQRSAAADLLTSFEPDIATRSLIDVIELANLQKFIESGLLDSFEALDPQMLPQSKLKHITGVVARYFNGVNDTNILSIVGDAVGWQYADDLIELFVRFNVFKRCAAEMLFTAFDRARIGIDYVLANEKAVKVLGMSLRDRLMSDPRHAEAVIRKHLQLNANGDIHLPSQLTYTDARQLVSAYLDLPDANLSVVSLVAVARVKRNGIVSSAIKVKAKRVEKQLSAALFKDSTSVEMGIEVALSRNQASVVDVQDSDHVFTYSYQEEWLSQTFDEASILNNFIHVFDFADAYMRLTTPAVQAERGVFDRFLFVQGQESYPAGAAFRAKQALSQLQTMLYDHYLRNRGIEIETIVSWFFSTYMRDEFGAAGLRYQASSSGATYLERCRHLLVEMESVAKQYALIVQFGEMDEDLLQVDPDQVDFRALPSILTGKYAYVTSDPVVQNVQHILFSDQSRLTYISDELSESSASKLLRRHHVSYADFTEYQRPIVDYLIEQQVLGVTDGRVTFVNDDEYGVLKDLFYHEAAPYFHYPPAGREAVERLVERGWLERASLLLSRPEAAYFNYNLNGKDFADGPNLRNSYLHGSNADPKNENAHQQSYLSALKLLIMLVIKINDDQCLSDAESQETLDR